MNFRTPSVAICGLYLSTVACTVEPKPLNELVTHGETIEFGEAGELDEDASDPATTVTRAVDLLFVIDNSSTMAPVQARLARQIPALIDGLADPERALDYRIGFTSTDNGHAHCPRKPGSGGELQLSSCQARAEQFVDLATTRSVFHTGCRSHCSRGASELVISPTTVEDDPIARPRPWIESVAGRTNLPPGVSPAEAAACFLPPGIAGCGYEAPLESAYRAIGLSLDPESAHFGFVRKDASLVIVIVTDEGDCSYDHRRDDARSIFEPDDSTFWSDPDVGPSSAICWNAGVQCHGVDGDQFERCDAVQHAADGRPVNPDDPAAVLMPLERYFGMFDALRARKRAYGHDLTVYYLGGVNPLGRPYYPRFGDPDFRARFGIGPGCRGSARMLEEEHPVGSGQIEPAHDVELRAIPPVRTLPVLARYSPTTSADAVSHSICADDYAPQFRRIVEHLDERFRSGTF